MLNITDQYKQKVISTLLDIRVKFEGSDSVFSKQWGINSSVFSRLKNGEIEGLLKDMQWINIGRELNVPFDDKKWNMAKTEVFEMIENGVVFCQEFSKGMMYVDDCGIGKTYTAKFLSRTLKNCFYIDASQAKGSLQLIKLLAKTIGLDTTGKSSEIRENIKYYLKMLHKPIIIIDEAGDLKEPDFLAIKEFWNATEGACGWYLIGAEGFKKIMDKGISSKRPGFREVFSRLSEKYSKTVPTGKDDKIQFYRKLISDVLSVNTDTKDDISPIIKKCLIIDESGNIGGLRRAESLLKLHLS